MSRAERRRTAELRTALAQLPEQQREIFRAVAIDGASYTVIAERLGTSTAEVERQLAAVMVALDKDMAPPVPPRFWQRLARLITQRPGG